MQLWRPDPAAAQATAMHALQQQVQAAHPEVRDYAALHRWSVRYPEALYAHVLALGEVIFEGSASPAMRRRAMPDADFFPNMRLNYAENLLRRRDAAPAVVGRSEARPPQRLSFAALAAEVGRVSAGLRALGIGPGDRVAGFLPNIPEAVVAMLASSAVGAIWSSCSPDFGAAGALDRFAQIRPRLLVAVDGYVYAGKTYGCADKVAAMRAALPAEMAVLWVSLTGPPPPAPALRWEAFGAAAAPTFTRLPFAQPLAILYSSGTTGAPKGIVHGAGNVLLQHLKELRLHSDINAGDNLLYYTTCGWMMWNWMASALACGATITLVDGAPGHPAPGSLWDVVDAEQVTHFGTSARFLAGCRQHRLAPRRGGRLACLRAVLSTGSPLQPADFDWVAAELGVQLSSISGGTDIVGCFMLGCPTLPVTRGEIQCLGLGMDVVSLGDDNQPVWGEAGELCCRTPFASMPVAFWDDPDGQRYRDAYFARLPGAWCHGDSIVITGSQGQAGGVVVLGRSDATLKPAGVRIGTAEIYRLVEALPEVEDSVVVGQPWEGDVRIVLFVKMRPPHACDADFVARLRQAVRAGATPRHVPAVVLSVGAIPYTHSGKKMELAVRDAVVGRAPRGVAAMQDPAALAHFVGRPELAAAAGPT